MLKVNTSKRKFVRSLLVLGLLFVVITSPVTYASDFGTKAFSNLFSLLAQLSDQNTNPQLQAEIEKTSNSFDAIVNELNGREGEIPPAFISSIDAYREQLLRALDAKSAGEATELIGEVNQDAEIKRRYMVGTSGFSAFDRPVLVIVNVVTFRGEKSEPGYTVTCNPFRDALQKSNARFPFASETNHASLPMPPGRYRLQIYKGQKMVLSRDILVGLSSKKSEEVRIDVSNF